MENERNVNKTNEVSINKRDNTKEMLIMNQFKGLIDFKVFERSTYCEDNFYSTIARYIDCLEKEGGEWEEKIKELLNSIKNYKGKETDKIKSLYLFFYDKKIRRYEENGWETNAAALRLSRLDISIREEGFIPNEQGKIGAIFPGIVSAGIPERYYQRYTESGVEEKVINENRKNFLDSMKKQREKADKLKRKL